MSGVSPTILHYTIGGDSKAVFKGDSHVKFLWGTQKSTEISWITSPTFFKMKMASHTLTFGFAPLHYFIKEPSYWYRYLLNVQFLLPSGDYLILLTFTIVEVHCADTQLILFTNHTKCYIFIRIYSSIT